ncbi:ribosome-associated translation inhibitor RaiA [candidate division WOR-3 bacterium]|nr:ribosome-associated translation inhibitor RaiA [candidate division WOR-3 bacterium]
MQVNISWRGIEPSDTMKEVVNKKVSNLERFSKRILNAEVVLAREGARYLSELEVKLGKASPFFAKEQAYDIYQALDSCVAKIKRRIKQYKSKIRQRK